MVPTAFLLIVIVAILSEKGECNSPVAENASMTTIHCELEPRTFVNAYTSTCICDAIRADMDEVVVEGEN